MEGTRRWRLFTWLLLLAGVSCVTGWTLPATEMGKHIGNRARNTLPALPMMNMLSAPVILRDAPAPAGPDPYKLVCSEIEQIIGGVKEVLTANGQGGRGALFSNDMLSHVVQGVMERKGKSFRPMIVLLIGACATPHTCQPANLLVHCNVSVVPCYSLA